jgi:nicotinate-nucleotide pyrophosphorylase (carboxylating)
MIPLLEADALIGLALREDIGDGDITTTSIIRSPVKAAARLIAQQRLVLAGLDIVQRVFEKLDPEVEVRKNHDDGEAVGQGEVVLEIEGTAAAMLAGERIALNFIQRHRHPDRKLCGQGAIVPGQDLRYPQDNPWVEGA